MEVGGSRHGGGFGVVFSGWMEVGCGNHGGLLERQLGRRSARREY